MSSKRRPATTPNVRNSRDEEQPLLRTESSTSSTPGLRATRWGWTLSQDVRRDWADVVLLLCYLVTGILDSSATAIWGAFVSMQTGNTVYVGMGFAAPGTSMRWIKSLLSVCCFCLGSFCFSHFHRYFSPKRRWVLCASFGAQAVITAAAATIVTVTPCPAKESVGWQVLVPLGLIAFQSCGQAVTSRALKYNSLTSVVLTSVYLDLFGDVELLASQNVERNRRIAAPLLLLTGALIGGLLAKGPVGTSGAFWVAAALKFVLVPVWAWWPGDEDQELEG